MPATTSRSARGVAALVAATLRVQELERELSVAEAEVKRLEEVELPAAFTEDGVSELRLPRGGPGARRDVSVQGSLPHEEPRHSIGLERLVEYGHEANIRSMVIANYDREHRDKAQELFEVLRTDNNAFVTLSETIHHSTLRALALQRVRDGLPTDLDNLGLIVRRRVRLIRPPTRHVSTEEQENA